MILNFSLSRTSSLICIATLFLFSCSNNKDESCTTDLSSSEKTRVIDLVNTAVDHFKNTPHTWAVGDFQDQDVAFTDEEFYIFVFQYDGYIIAHGGDPELQGTNQYDLQDVDGKYIVQEIIESIDNDKKEGWSCYSWENPVTQTVQQKYTYTTKT